MNTKRVSKIIGVVILITIGIGFIFIGDSNQVVQPIQKVESTNAGTISLSIDGLYTNKAYPITAGETVLMVLEDLNKQDEAVKLITKEYEGLGVLVQSINGKTNDTANNYWQYRVNGVMPQLGADKFVLKNGDEIEWYFSVSKF